MSNPLPTFTRWIDIPLELRPSVLWQVMGRRVYRSANPQAMFRSNASSTPTPLYDLASTDRMPRAPRISTKAASDTLLVSAIRKIEAAAEDLQGLNSRLVRNNLSDPAVRREKIDLEQLRLEVLQRLVEHGRASRVDTIDLYGRPASAQRLQLGGAEFVVPLAPALNPAAHLQSISAASVRPVNISLYDALATLDAFLRQPRIILPCAVTKVRGELTDGDLIEVIAPPWLAICEAIGDDPRFLYSFADHSRNFEEFIAGAYHRAGFDEVILTPRSNDGGRDVIATKTGHISVRIIDQCKAYSANRRVDANDVRALLGVLTGFPNTSKAVLTTTAEFAPGIWSDQGLMPFFPHRVELRNGERLREWLQHISGADNAEF
jgi:restriction system protein